MLPAGCVPQPHLSPAFLPGFEIFSWPSIQLRYCLHRCLLGLPWGFDFLPEPLMESLTLLGGQPLLTRRCLSPCMPLWRKQPLNLLRR